MNSDLMALLLEKCIGPLRDLDDKLYHNKKREDDWRIIRTVGNDVIHIIRALQKAVEKDED